MDESIKKRAYLEGSKLKRAGYDDDIIMARLEKIGVNEQLSKEVIFNLTIQQAVDNDKLIKPFYKLAIFKIIVGLSLAILSLIIYPKHIIFPIGMIVAGTVSAIATKRKML